MVSKPRMLRHGLEELGVVAELKKDIADVAIDLWTPCLEVPHC